MSSADTMVSVAVAVAVIDNLATATVHGDAKLDGLRATRVIADVSYPFLTRFDQYIPLSWGEFVDSIRNEGYDSVLKYVNTTLGLKDSFFNTLDDEHVEGRRRSASPARSTVLVLTNTAKATVESRRRDQPGYSTGARRDHRNNRNNTTAATDPDGARGRAGRLDRGDELPAVHQHGRHLLAAGHRPRREGREVQGPDLAEPGRHRGLQGRLRRRRSTSASRRTRPTRSSSDGAKVYSGFDGGFNMKAEEAIFHIDLVQSGATGGEFAIAGSVAYIGQDSDTLVRLGATAMVTGRDVRLYAGNLTTQVTWVGAITMGEGVGVGISVAINDLDRTTRAVIGDPDALTSSGTAATPFAEHRRDRASSRCWRSSTATSGRSASPARSPSPASPTPTAARGPRAQKALTVLGADGAAAADRHRGRRRGLGQHRPRHDAGLDRRRRPRHGRRA